VECEAYSSGVGPEARIGVKFIEDEELAPFSPFIFDPSTLGTLNFSSL
jgi:hypothetical protein